MVGLRRHGLHPTAHFGGAQRCIELSFNLSLRMENAGFPGNTSTITVHGVKLDGWSYAMPEDDFVLEEVSFRALWISVEDAGT